MKASLESRIDRFHQKEPMSGCWLWVGELNMHGYGMILVDGSRKRAHRESWKLSNGNIPDGMCVLHSCDVRSCINPKHLFLGTNADNTSDMIAKGRGVNLCGESSGSAKLTIEKALDIRSGRLSGSQFSRLYKIGRSTVCHIQKRRTWASIP